VYQSKRIQERKGITEKKRLISLDPQKCMWKVNIVCRSICHSHLVNTSHEQGTHPAGHVDSREQGLLMALNLQKAITASSMHSTSIKILTLSSCRAQPTKGIDWFLTSRSTSIFGPTAVE
jgi:hypothetical protein